MPLPIILGHIQSLVEQRAAEGKDDEVIGYYMLRGGSPCAVYSYYHYIEQFIKDNKLKNVFIFRFDQLTNFLGLSRITVAQYAPRAILLGDIMLEIENALMVVGEENSIQLLHQYWDDFLDKFTSLGQFNRLIDELIINITNIPRKDSPRNYPKVMVTGDFFVRFSPFFLRELREIYAKHGIILKSNDLYELVLYSSHYLNYIVSKLWQKPAYGFSTIIQAISTIWKKYSQLYLISKITPVLLAAIEKRFRKKFEVTGLLFADANNLHELFKYSNPLISPLIFGEAIPAVGKGIETLKQGKYDSLVLTGPQYCLPYKISQAVLKPIYLENQMPFLVFDADISALTPNMKRMIYANIEQIKRRRRQALEQKLII